MDILTWIKAFITWLLPSPIKTMIAAVLLAGLALFLPNPWQQNMGIGVWTGTHKVGEWGVFLFCSFFLLLSGLEYAREEHKQRDHLNHLALDEREILAHFFATRSCTCEFQPGDVGIHSLMRDGILEQAKDSHGFFQSKGMGAFYYSIAPKTLRYLLKHPKLITSVPKSNI